MRGMMRWNKPCDLQEEKFSLRRPIRARRSPPPSEPDNPFVTTVTCLAEIVAEPVDWLWGDVIPQGKVTLFTGASGVGKSFVALDIVAAVTRGQRAAQAETLDEPGEVLLIIAPEYELADLVRPRLEAADAQIARVHAVRGVRRRNPESDGLPCWLFQLNEDLRLLELEIAQRKEARSPLRLIVIDPFPAELFGLRHGMRELNQTMKHLAEIAAWSQTAILLVTETPTPSRGNLAKIVGTLEATVPSAWMIVCDLNNSDRKLLLPIKLNLKEKSPGLSFMLRDGCVQWEADAVWLTAEQFQAESLERSQSPLYEQEWGELARATHWLKRRLKTGIVALRDIKLESAANDISYTTLRRAFCGLRGISRRSWKCGLWEWTLPPAETVPARLPPRLDPCEPEEVPTASNDDLSPDAEEAPLDAV